MQLGCVHCFPLMQMFIKLPICVYVSDVKHQTKQNPDEVAFTTERVELISRSYLSTANIEGYWGITIQLLNSILINYFTFSCFFRIRCNLFFVRHSNIVQSTCFAGLDRHHLRQIAFVIHRRQRALKTQTSTAATVRTIWQHS